MSKKDWLILVFAVLLSFFNGYFTGKKHVRREWNAWNAMHLKQLEDILDTSEEAQ